MATRKPLVIIAGRIQELPANDTILMEEDMYQKRIDFINDNLLYKAEAVIGASESSQVWRIRKIVIGNDGDVSETWAEGSGNFSFAWADRLTYNYS